VTSGTTAGTEVGRAMRPAEAEARSENGMVRVWDPFVRLFHWSLVALFAATYLTGEELGTLHEWLGYAIVALLVVRIVWGFVGSEHARFRDFVYSPQTVIGYARDALTLRAKRYLGHNPVGGVMVLLMMVGLLVTCGTGWLLSTGAGDHHALEEVHEVAANGMLVLIGLHVAGVLLSSLEHGENLVRSMVTGFKRA
jgi:cytochrome b